MKRFGVALLLALSLIGVPSAAASVPTAPGAAPNKAKVNKNASLSLTTIVPLTQFDPHLEAGQAARAYYFEIYDRLFYIDKNIELQPMLASTWTFTPDGKALTIKLRTDAKFHDGSPVDATAVKASIDHAKTLPKSTAASQLTSVDSVDVVDSSTVRFNLNRQAADLPYALAAFPGMIINPKVIASGVSLAQGKPDDAGSGPWVVTSFTPNNSVSYTRSAVRYWDKKAGLIKNITISLTADATTALNQVTSGQVDAGLIRDPVVDAARHIAGHRFFQYGTVTNLKLMFNNKRPPFDKMAVRQAVAMAIDKDAIGNQLLGGRCVPTDQEFLPGTFANDTKLKNPVPFNVTKAKQKLADAGYPNGVEFTMVIPTALEPSQSAGTVLQQQLLKAGIKVNLQSFEVLTTLSDFAAGKYDALLTTPSGQPYPYLYLANYYLGGGLWNLAGPDTDTIKPAALAALDPTLTKAQLAQKWAQIDQTLAEYQWDVPICFLQAFWSFPKDVVGAKHMSYVWQTSFDVRYLSRTAKK